MLSVGAGMDNVTLKLQISILKAIVALCHVTGESLRQTFEHGHLEPNEKRAVFVRWCQVRQNSDMAEAALERSLDLKTDQATLRAAGALDSSHFLKRTTHARNVLNARARGWDS